METTLPPASTRPDILQRFFKVFSRDDTFTVLYILTKAESPRSVEDLCRDYAASPQEMKDRLVRLGELQLVNRKGRNFVARPAAIDLMRLLEDRFGRSELPASQVITVGASLVESVRFPTDAGLLPLVEGRTNNGTSFSVTMTAKASDRGQTVAPEAIRATDENSASVNILPKQPSAAQSQVYETRSQLRL
jgi:hypothetical protein